jgi:hypothetical protein
MGMNRMNQTQKTFLRSRIAPALAALACCGAVAAFWPSHPATLQDVLEAASREDAKIDDFCSRVAFTTYDDASRVVTPEKRGYRYYAKPDRSIVCLDSDGGAKDIYAEVGRLVRTKVDDEIRVSTIPDSYFLRDLRSMLGSALSSDAGMTEASVRPNVRLEPGGGIRRPILSHGGDYILSVTTPNVETAIARINLQFGVVEKTVRTDPGGTLVSQETHSTFTPVGGSYLPQHTVYKYRGLTTDIRLWAYRANVRLSPHVFEVPANACEQLSALFD